MGWVCNKKANIKIFKTPESSFSTGMVVHFCIFLEYINILGEAVHSQMARQRDDQTDKKRDISQNHQTTGMSNKPGRQ